MNKNKLNKIPCSCGENGAQCMIHNPPFPFKEGIDFVQTPPYKEHICCDGECNHDDCCGKVPENCPNDLINKIKAMPTEFPDIESDMFDMGYKQCKADILAIINK